MAPAHPDRLPKRPSRGSPCSQTTGWPQTNLKRKLVCYGGEKKFKDTILLPEFKASHLGDPSLQHLRLWR